MKTLLTLIAALLLTGAAVALDGSDNRNIPEQARVIEQHYPSCQFMEAGVSRSQTTVRWIFQMRPGGVEGFPDAPCWISTPANCSVDDFNLYVTAALDVTSYTLKSIQAWELKHHTAIFVP
jgi:hypothetical protein